jgi:cellulose synthase/poly-beta-1,6-N-acetylglucosamine synthase-like glycosyltransferase
MTTAKYRLTVERDGDSKNVWVKMNGGQRGFYRVNYDEENWNSLEIAIRNNPDLFSEVCLLIFSISFFFISSFFILFLCFHFLSIFIILLLH